MDQMQSAFEELCMDIERRHIEEEKKEEVVHPELEEERAKKRAE